MAHWVKSSFKSVHTCVLNAQQLVELIIARYTLVVCRLHLIIHPLPSSMK